MLLIVIFFIAGWVRRLRFKSTIKIKIRRYWLRGQMGVN